MREGTVHECTGARDNELRYPANEMHAFREKSRRKKICKDEILAVCKFEPDQVQFARVRARSFRVTSAEKIHDVAILTHDKNLQRKIGIICCTNYKIRSRALAHMYLTFL